MPVLSSRCVRAAATLTVVAVALAACSDGDDDAGATRSDVETSVSAPRVDTSDPSVTDAPTSPPSDPSAGTGAGSLPTVPDAGVPGLDSDDIVCRSWSRFGGSFQVVAVAATFSEMSPLDKAALEVVAAPVVVASYDELLDNWPAELEPERELVAEQFLGPFARRATTVRELLVEAGADDAMLDTITEAWLAALAERDPEQPDLAVDLPDDVWTVVDTAAADLMGRFVPLPADPSLVTDVEVPKTEQFLVEHCPDQGTLGGGDVTG